jgi:hypothetical protein
MARVNSDTRGICKRDDSWSVITATVAFSRLNQAGCSRQIGSERRCRATSSLRCSAMSMRGIGAPKLMLGDSCAPASRNRKTENRGSQRLPRRPPGLELTP